MEKLERALVVYTSVKDSQGYQHQKKISEKIIIPICAVKRKMYILRDNHECVCMYIA